MQTHRRLKVLATAIGVTVALAVAFLLHAKRLMGGNISDSIILFSSAAACLLLSRLVSVVKDRSNCPQPKQQRQVSVVSTQKDGLELSSSSGRFVKKSPVTNAFSIDLEDYFHTEVASKAVSFRDWDSMPSHLELTVPRLLDLLDEHDTKATIFVLGWIAKKKPALVHEIANRGHEVGCHSFQHRAVFRLDRVSFCEDTSAAKKAIEDATGVRVAGYRAPCFSVTSGTEWAFDVLADLGFRYDSSINPVWHTFYGNSSAPRFPYYVADDRLLEIPIASWRLWGVNLPIGGGAYLRLLPYWYSAMGLRSMNSRECHPGTIYLHPWEIDHQQPLKLPVLSGIRQTWGTATMERKIKGLLGDFHFAPLAEVYSNLLVSEEADGADSFLVHQESGARCNVVSHLRGTEDVVAHRESS